VSREIARGYVSDCGGLSGDFSVGVVKALRKHQLSHRMWLAVNERRAVVKAAWASMFAGQGEDGVDVLLAPLTVASAAAFCHDSSHTKGVRPLYMPSGRTIAVNGTRSRCYLHRHPHCLTFSPSHLLTIAPSHTFSSCICSSSYYLTFAPSHHHSFSPSHLLTFSPSRVLHTTILFVACDVYLRNRGC
jgi:hypothetical protein